jgi:hypothetical protein
MELEKFFSTMFSTQKKHENEFLWYVAVEGAKMALVLG